MSNIVDEPPSFIKNMHRAIRGTPEQLKEPQMFHKISLTPIPAWIGLGADALTTVIMPIRVRT